METKYNFDLQVYKTVANNINKYLNEKNMSIKNLAHLAQIKHEYLLEFLNSDKNLTISIYDLYFK